MPLDTYVETPAMLMATTKGDPTPTIWAEYQEIINKNNGETKMGQYERFEFYDEAKKAYDEGTAQENSYTCYLYSKGVDKICKKIGEEASETIIAAKNGSSSLFK